MANVTVKRKEAKTLRFTLTIAGAAADLTGASFRFWVESEPGVFIIQKENADFSVVGAPTDGIVDLPLSQADLDQAENTYKGELEVTFAADNIDKSVDIEFNIERAVVTA